MKYEVWFCDGCLEPITNQWLDDNYVDGHRRFHWDGCQRIFDEAVEMARLARKKEEVA